MTTDRSTHALIVVDMQNLFVETVGDRGPAVVEVVNAEIARARNQGSPVFYTRDYAPSVLPSGDPEGKTELYPGMTVDGTVVLKGPGRNGGFSGFILSALPEGTDDRGSISDHPGQTDRKPVPGPGIGGLSDLAGLLHDANVRSVTVVGIATDVCVAATARDARRFGYDVTIPLRATAFVGAHPGGNDAAVADLRAAGVTVIE